MTSRSSFSKNRGFGKARNGYGVCLLRKYRLEPFTSLLTIGFLLKLLPEPAVLSSARYRHHKSFSDPRLQHTWLSRPLQRLLIRAVVLTTLGVVVFLVFLRIHKPSKQAVEDLIKCATPL